MSEINFSDVSEFANMSLFNVDKTQVQEQYQILRSKVSTLHKLFAVKNAIEHSSIGTTINNINKIENINTILSVSNEELANKTAAQTVDIYKTNTNETIDKTFNEITDLQINLTTAMSEAATTYETVLAEFQNIMQTKLPLNLSSIANKISDDTVISYKVPVNTEYFEKIKAFKNRFVYLASFLKPTNGSSEVLMPEIISGLPYANTLVYEESDEVLFIAPTTLKTKTKLATTGWSAQQVQSALNNLQYDNKVYEYVKKLSDNINLINSKYKKTTLVKCTPIIMSMCNLLNDYIYTQEAFMSMVYNLTK